MPRRNITPTPPPQTFPTEIQQALHKDSRKYWRQAVQIQDLVFLSLADPNTTGAHRAQLARAWSELQDRRERMLDRRKGLRGSRGPRRRQVFGAFEADPKSPSVDPIATPQVHEDGDDAPLPHVAAGQSAPGVGDLLSGPAGVDPRYLVPGTPVAGIGPGPSVPRPHHPFVDAAAAALAAPAAQEDAEQEPTGEEQDAREHRLATRAAVRQRLARLAAQRQRQSAQAHAQAQPAPMPMPAGPQPCPTCAGIGHVLDALGRVKPCPACQ